MTGPDSQIILCAHGCGCGRLLVRGNYPKVAGGRAWIGEKVSGPTVPVGAVGAGSFVAAAGWRTQRKGAALGGTRAARDRK